MKILRSILSFILIDLTLLASTGVTLNFHLCAGGVESFAFYVKAKPCDNRKKSCHDTYTHTMKGCCKDKTFIVKEDEANAEVKNGKQSTPHFNLVSIVAPFQFSIPLRHAYTFYKTPFIRRDIIVLVQTFLI